jgi:hypothetical protein
MNPHPKQIPPPYFKLKSPGHFYIRTDLLEELCYKEALEGSLPTDHNSHARWIKLHGLKAEEYTLGKIWDDNCHLIPQGEDKRYILHAPVLPQNRSRSYLVTNSLGYSAVCEGAGLFEFVMLRAVAYAAWRGVAQATAWHYLHATSPKDREANSPRISPKWGVGFERETGLCTILAISEPNTEARFLAGKPGYFVPNFTA